MTMLLAKVPVYDSKHILHSQDLSDSHEYIYIWKQVWGEQIFYNKEFKVAQK